MSHALSPLAAKLSRWPPLAAGDREAWLDLPHRIARYRPQELIVREGEAAQAACLMLSGFSFRHKFAGNGGRQIFSVHMAGDLADPHSLLLAFADHNLQAANPVEAALIPVEALRRIAFDRPGMGRAMWRETLVDAAIFREWTLNVGRRDSRSRTAHLLCELGLRLEAAGLGGRRDYAVPMSQEQLADALGLTSVHVNRTLRLLAGEGLIAREQRAVRILDWEGLSRAGDFDPAYLHLEKRAA